MEKGTGGVEICGETGAGEDVEAASVKPVEDCSDLTWMLASLAMCRVPGCWRHLMPRASNPNQVA